MIFLACGAGGSLLLGPAVEAGFVGIKGRTYVTIGSVDAGTHGQTRQQGISRPAGPGFGESSLDITNGSWYRTPGDPATFGRLDDDGTWIVIVGQFTHQRDETLDGMIDFAGDLDGRPTTLTGVQFTLVPAPGVAAPPVALVMLAGRRRRGR